MTSGCSMAGNPVSTLTGNLLEEEKQAHIIFFDQMVNYYIDKENRLFVHAGFTNQKGPEQEYTPTPFYWDRTLWEMAMCIDPDPKTRRHRISKTA